MCYNTLHTTHKKWASSKCINQHTVTASILTKLWKPIHHEGTINRIWQLLQQNEHMLSNNWKTILELELAWFHMHNPTSAHLQFTHTITQRTSQLPTPTLLRNGSPDLIRLCVHYHIRFIKYTPCLEVSCCGIEHQYCYNQRKEEA